MTKQIKIKWKKKEKEKRKRCHFTHTCMHFSNSKKASNPSRNLCRSSSDHVAGLLINTYLRETTAVVNTYATTSPQWSWLDNWVKTHLRSKIRLWTLLNLKACKAVYRSNWNLPCPSRCLKWSMKVLMIMDIRFSSVMSIRAWNKVHHSAWWSATVD